MVAMGKLFLAFGMTDNQQTAAARHAILGR
jgi:hypothetical protein